MSDPRRVTGLLLIAGGLFWVLLATTDLDGTILVPIIGVGFLLGYAATRRYGFLVPGGILTGLGAGLVVASQGGPGESVLLGLGLGFVSIVVIDALAGTGDGGAAWWPLIPGGILTVLGGAQIAGIRDVGIYLVPAVLILIGLFLLLRPSGRRSGTREAGAGDEETTQR